MRRLFLATAVFTLLFTACDDESPLPLGSACDESSHCEGVCNLGLPEGMCVEVCDAATTCPDGASCVDFGEASYCMPTCSGNEECREGYSCVDFTCAPLQPVGAACDDATDCLPCEAQESCPEGTPIECRENVCATPCRNQTDCAEGTVCAESDGSYWCVGVYFAQGPGTAGEICAVQECAEGFTCLDDLLGFDSLAFCSNECVTDRECPPSLTCRSVQGHEGSWCVPREYCESCGIDSHCASPADTCVTSGGGNPYCTSSCDIALPGTCPADSTCMETFYCEDDSSWVADCSHCSGTNCASLEAPFYACFKTVGECVGTGDVCEGCHMDEQCTTSGGCVEDPTSGNTICADLCAAGDICPDGYMCVPSGSAQVCVPRTGACTAPSGDKETCETCQEWSQCLRGGCLPLPSDLGGDTFCLDFCETSTECGDNATCEEITVDFGTYSACVPDATAIDCTGWLAL